MQSVAVCCSLLQSAAVCNVSGNETSKYVQPIAFGVLFNLKTATDCNRLQQTATHIPAQIQHLERAPQGALIHCTLQQTATDCNKLQQIATDCNRLQHCNTLQNIYLRRSSTWRARPRGPDTLLPSDASRLGPRSLFLVWSCIVSRRLVLCAQPTGGV